jgi:hypothetical protein
MPRPKFIPLLSKSWGNASPTTKLSLRQIGFQYSSIQRLNFTARGIRTGLTANFSRSLLCNPRHQFFDFGGSDLGKAHQRDMSGFPLSKRLPPPIVLDTCKPDSAGNLLEKQMLCISWIAKGNPGGTKAGISTRSRAKRIVAGIDTAHTKESRWNVFC